MISTIFFDVDRFHIFKSDSHLFIQIIDSLGFIQTGSEIQCSCICEEEFIQEVNYLMMRGSGRIISSIS